jgi:glycerophosphoryl diester phosphodiesterase
MHKFHRYTFTRQVSFSFFIALMVIAELPGSFMAAQSQSKIQNLKSKTQRPLLVAHRGASGYAPEHTLLAYELAIAQGADFVEQDLQITKDGVLVCMHDPEMSRTTNVKQVFPDRATERDVEGQGNKKRGWYVVDFTLAEIKQLDAESWFYTTNPFIARPDEIAEFGKLRVLTLDETIRVVRDRAGLYIELKHYEFYKALGFDGAKKLAEVLKANGYAKAPKSKRVFIQSFFKEALLAMRQVAPQYARVQLLPMEDPKRADTKKVTAELAKEIAAYAQGAGPAKQMLTAKSDVDIFHAAGLVIHPYTFRGPTGPVIRKPLDAEDATHQTTRQAIIDDIRHYLELGIDGGFTDYPALWKEALQAEAKDAAQKRATD